MANLRELIEQGKVRTLEDDSWRLTQDLAAQTVDVWLDAWAKTREVEAIEVHGRMHPTPFHRMPARAHATKLLVEFYQLATLAVHVAGFAGATLPEGSLPTLSLMLGRGVVAELREVLQSPALPSELESDSGSVRMCRHILNVAQSGYKPAALLAFGRFGNAEGPDVLQQALNDALCVAAVGKALGDPTTARVFDILRTVSIELRRGKEPLADVNLAYPQATQRGTHAKTLNFRTSLVAYLADFGGGARTLEQNLELTAGLAVLMVAVEHGSRNGARCLDVLIESRNKAVRENGVEDNKVPREVVKRLVAHALSAFGHNGDALAPERQATRRATKREATLSLRELDPAKFRARVRVAMRAARPEDSLGVTLKELREFFNEDTELKALLEANQGLYRKLKRG